MKMILWVLHGVRGLRVESTYFYLTTIYLIFDFL